MDEEIELVSVDGSKVKVHLSQAVAAAGARIQHGAYSVDLQDGSTVEIKRHPPDEVKLLLERVRREIRGGESIADSMASILDAHEERARRVHVNVDNVVELLGLKDGLVKNLRRALAQAGDDS